VIAEISVFRLGIFFGFGVPVVGRAITLEREKQCRTRSTYWYCVDLGIVCVGFGDFILHLASRKLRCARLLDINDLL
jgi:hypothetical protein